MLCLAVLLAVLPLNIALAQNIHGRGNLARSQSQSTLDNSGGEYATGRLQGHILVSEGPGIVGRRIDDLLGAALERDPQTAVLDEAVEHYRTRAARISAGAKDSAEFLVCYKGFGPSSEAGDVITGEKLKLHNAASAEYARQKHIDELHTKIVSSLLQISMGLGMANNARSQETINSGVDSLRPLVGDDQANETKQLLTSWSKRVRVPEQIFKQPVWDVERRNQMQSAIVKTALARDPVVIGIQNHIHKYNHLSKFARASGKVCSTVLGVLSRTPVVHHAGTPVLVGYLAATGGPEQSKIMKELYLDRRYASRLQVMSEETHMAMDNYQLALVTHNPCLLACSESVIQDLAGPEVVGQYFGRSVLPGPKTINPLARTDLADNAAPPYRKSAHTTGRKSSRSQIGFQRSAGL